MKTADTTVADVNIMQSIVQIGSAWNADTSSWWGQHVHSVIEKCEVLHGNIHVEIS